MAVVGTQVAVVIVDAVEEASIGRRKAAGHMERGNMDPVLVDFGVDNRIVYQHQSNLGPRYPQS